MNENFDLYSGKIAKKTVAELEDHEIMKLACERLSERDLHMIIERKSYAAINQKAVTEKLSKVYGQALHGSFGGSRAPDIAKHFYEFTIEKLRASMGDEAAYNLLHSSLARLQAGQHENDRSASDDGIIF